MPETLIKALIATEDTRFYSHHGLDFHGIARAFYRNIKAKKVVEGGSSLTQQLAKVLFLTPERSYTRKFKEMALALRIEQRYTKNEILSLYLNQIYFGNGAYGVEAAARIYFGKSAKNLDIAECALLAGLPRSPLRYSPFKSPQNALSRRAYVLNRMAAMQVITKAQADEAKQIPLPVQPNIQRREVRPPILWNMSGRKSKNASDPAFCIRAGSIFTPPLTTATDRGRAGCPDRACQDRSAARQKERATAAHTSRAYLY